MPHAAGEMATELAGMVSGRAACRTDSSGFYFLPRLPFRFLYMGNGPDPPQSIWFLAWWAHASTARINPFFTHALWAPAGFNLAWTTNIPLAAWLMLPVTYTLGAVAAYKHPSACFVRRSSDGPRMYYAGTSCASSRRR